MAIAVDRLNAAKMATAKAHFHLIDVVGFVFKCINCHARRAQCFRALILDLSTRSMRRDVVRSNVPMINDLLVPIVIVTPEALVVQCFGDQNSMRRSVQN